MWNSLFLNGIQIYKSDKILWNRFKYNKSKLKKLCRSQYKSNSRSRSIIFFFTKSDLSNGVKKILGNAKQGSFVLLWLGVNNLNSGSTFDYYKNLALQYKNLKFYAISVTGVVQSIVKSISNDTIRKFNLNLKNNIHSSKIPNLKYKSILNNENPVEIAMDGKVVGTINSSTSRDGLHYSTILDKVIFQVMTNGLK